MTIITALLIGSVTLGGCASAGTSPSLDRHQAAAAAPRDNRVVSEQTSAEITLSAYEEPAKDLQGWATYALNHNPQVIAAKAQYQFAAEQVEQASALPEPRLSYKHYFEEVETRVGPQKYAVGVAQPLPWLSKLRLQSEVATQKARAAAARVSNVQNQIISDVATAWYELYYFDRALQIMRGNRDLIVHLERVARTRYGTGAAGHPDVIRAQVELGKIENDLASLSDREAPLVARLNAALNRPPFARIALPSSAPVERLTEPEEEIIQRVASNNPELEAITLELAAATTAKERAQKDFFPDFTFGIDYIGTGSARTPDVSGSGEDPVAAAFTMTLPIHRNKYGAGVRAAEANIAGEQARRDHQLNKLQTDTISALFRLRDAERQIDLYQNTLLPKAHESLIATQRAYSAGGSTFADLIDAQRMLLVFELAEIRAVADHNLARTALEKLMGAPLAMDAPDRESSDD